MKKKKENDHVSHWTCLGLSSLCSEVYDTRADTMVETFTACLCLDKSPQKEACHMHHFFFFFFIIIIYPTLLLCFTWWFDLHNLSLWFVLQAHFWSSLTFSYNKPCHKIALHNCIYFACFFLSLIISCADYIHLLAAMNGIAIASGSYCCALLNLIIELSFDLSIQVSPVWTVGHQTAAMGVAPTRYYNY